ncbi:MAG: DUF342 domain-containing protein [Thermoleophilia bacterium]|nr:DUF342 domain-containing protein [Thermoleophilia bacterium]
MMSGTTPPNPITGTEAALVSVSVRNGYVVIDGPIGSDLSAELSWEHGVNVSLFGEKVEGGSCRVRPGDDLRVDLVNIVARIDFEVEISASSLSATLTVRPVTGHARRLADADANANLHLRVIDDVVQPDPPTVDDAMRAVVAGGVVHGIDREAIAAAIAQPRTQYTVAVATDPVPGRHGRLEQLVDFSRLRTVGVAVGTQLLRLVPKIEGTPGRDVRGYDIAVKPTRDARVVPGSGVELDAEGAVVTATLDGQPWFDGESRVEVREELELLDVNMETGDIDFCGSVHVRGNIGEGRVVRARHALRVGGSVDRAVLESGTELEVQGAVMSSKLRAGGARAIAATLLEIVSAVPVQLDQALMQAGELMIASATRGTQLPWGLAMQLVLERGFSDTIHALTSAAAECASAGESWSSAHQDFTDAARTLQTVAIEQRSHHDVAEMVGRLQRHVSEMSMLVANPADMTVSYMQSSEAESSGAITLAGPGAVDCRIVAWAGIRSVYPKAVIRGGTLVSHGPVDIGELGTPSGARMHVQLGREAQLDSTLVRAGTLVTCGRHTHRFLADRSSVIIRIDDAGMDVTSLAA